jgi:hypothetical protein
MRSAPVSSASLLTTEGLEFQHTQSLEKMAEMEGMIREMVKKVLMAQLYHRYPQVLSTRRMRRNALRCNAGQPFGHLTEVRASPSDRKWRFRGEGNLVL